MIEWIIASKSLGALHVRAGVVARARRASLPHRRGENGKTGGKWWIFTTSRTSGARGTRDAIDATTRTSVVNAVNGGR